MTLTTTTLDEATEKGLDVFDSVTHGAFGTGTTTPSSTQTTLVSEQYRNVILSSVKTVASGIYDIELRLPITQMNSQTLSELGLFDASSGGNMYGRLLLNTTISKSSDDEYVFSVRVKIQSSNN